MEYNLTTRQAFYSMHFFLDDYFKRTSSDSLGALLSCMQFLEDGKTADPALWDDWIDIIGEIKHITSLEGFEAMRMFLQSYYRTTSSNTIKDLLHDVNSTGNNQIEQKVWNNWIACITQVLQEQ